MSRRRSAADRSASGDLLALAKPGILVFSLLTTATSASVAPGQLSAMLWTWLLAGTALIVAAANTLNMYLERTVDRHMARTRTRPLPDGRMPPRRALAIGIVEAAVAVPMLSFGVNALTGLLAVVAFVSYVQLYTPLKSRTTLSTLIGAVPGAMPILMGWTAVTGGLEAGGLVLFAVLVFWQIPHFHAIAMFRSKDYVRAGLKVLPAEGGDNITRYAILLYLAVQVQLSLMLFPLGVAGRWYLLVALLLGIGSFAYALAGLRAGGARWARNLFLSSIVYLPLLLTALALDGNR